MILYHNFCNLFREYEVYLSTSHPPPTKATAEAVWCGARNGRCPKGC